MPVPALRSLSVRLARSWLLALIISMLAVFAASYFYFTSTHAFEVFDTGSCTPLAYGSPPGKCVSTLPEVLKNELPHPEFSLDGHCGDQTQQAVMDFQTAHDLTVDGVVGSETASALNEFSPPPGILGYAAGFMNSQLTLTAKLCVAILAILVTIICLLLRAALAASSGLLRIRFARTGLFAALFAANSATAESLITDAHGWVAKLLCVSFAALTAALLTLLMEMPRMSALSAPTDPQSMETQSQIRVDYGH